MSKIFLLFIAIFVIFGLRFYQLGNIPQGLTQDEAYYLYDGYSILRTGKDLWGNKLPLIFRSTGEYKLNLTYLIAASIPLVGLNTTAARLPSAVAGFLSLIVVGLIIFRLTKSRSLAIGSAILLAISPWQFGISRLFYESNVGALFVLLSTISAILILSSSTTHLTHWISLATFSALSAYFYGPYRYLGFGLVALTVILHWVKTRAFSRHFLWGVGIYLVLILPIISQIFGSQGLMRLRQTSGLQLADFTLKIDEVRQNCYLNSGQNMIATKICYLYWNKPILYVSHILQAGITMLSPDYLFHKSVDTYIIPREYGAFLSLLLPLYVIGFYALLRRGFTGQPVYIFLLFALLGNLFLAAISGEPSYHRFVYGLYLLSIFMALGYNQLVVWLKIAFRHNGIVLGVLVTLILVQGTRFLIYYYTTHVISQPLLFKYDAPDIYNYINQNPDYSVVDNIFFAPIYAGIYRALDPADFQQNAQWAAPDQWGFTNADRYRQFSFRGPSIHDLLCQKDANSSKPIRTYVIDDATGPYYSMASYVSRDHNGSLELHAVYDIDRIYAKIMQTHVGPLCSK